MAVCVSYQARVAEVLPMMVSERLKLVYLDPPKTGSQSFDRIFRNMGCTYIKYNQSGKWVDKHQRVIPEKYQDYKIVASVRNPYRRLFSYYHYDRRRKYNFIGLDMSTFQSYVEGIIEKTSHVPADIDDIAVYRYFPQWKYLSMNRVDHFLRLEHMKEDLAKAEITMKGKTTPKLNKVKYKANWDDIKTPKLIELINIWAGTDFEQYGYDRL